MSYLYLLLSIPLLFFCYKKKNIFILSLLLIYILSLLYKPINKNKNKEHFNVKEILNTKLDKPEINEEVYFVLDSLLENLYFEKNRENIEKVIRQYDVTDIFSLKDKILNLEKNNKYDNFLERITCIENGEVKYTNCNNKNYKKLFAFSELINVYCFSKEFVVKLINQDKVYRLCDLPKETLVNNGQYGYEYNGYLFYLNRISLGDKYYKLLELLGLDQLLENQNTMIPLKERLYNYIDINKQVSKDLNSLIILFDYYKILDDTRVKNEEDNYDYDYSLLRNIDLNKNYWNDNNYFKKYNIKNLIISRINNLTNEDKDIFRHKLNEKYAKNNSESQTVKEEFKVMNREKSQESVTFLEQINLSYIKDNFVNTFISIIEDIVKICNEKCKVESDENVIIKTVYFYITNIIKIFIKDGRMFYVGMFIVFLSIMLYFIEVSK